MDRYSRKPRWDLLKDTCPWIYRTACRWEGVGEEALKEDVQKLGEKHGMGNVSAGGSEGQLAVR